MNDKLDQLIVLLSKREKKIIERCERIEKEIKNIKEALGLIIEHQIELKREK
ncbi:MAG: hypothetical protein ACTSXD_06065 [Candidatus Heimdallarchaeaceae archaeon]